MPHLHFRRWILPLSLALNVFLGTVIILHPGRHRPGPPPPPREIAQRMAESLPPEDGAILLETFSQHAAEFERSHQIQHEAMERIRTALAARDFSRDALRAAFDVNRASRQVMDDALLATIVETASRMSPEGRALLANWRLPPPPPR